MSGIIPLEDDKELLPADDDDGAALEEGDGMEVTVEEDEGAGRDVAPLESNEEEIGVEVEDVVGGALVESTSMDVADDVGATLTALEETRDALLGAEEDENKEDGALLPDEEGRTVEDGPVDVATLVDVPDALLGWRELEEADVVLETALLVDETATCPLLVPMVTAAARQNPFSQWFPSPQSSTSWSTSQVTRFLQDDAVTAQQASSSPGSTPGRRIIRASPPPTPRWHWLRSPPGTTRS